MSIFVSVHNKSVLQNKKSQAIKNQCRQIYK